MCEFPIQLARLSVEGAEGKRSSVDPGDGRNLGIIAGREDFVRFLKILVSQSFFDDRDAARSEQPDYALASYAR
jgi:hypothetical protein